MSSYAATPFTIEMCQEKVKRREQMKKDGERLFREQNMTRCQIVADFFSISFISFLLLRKIFLQHSTCGGCLFQHHHYHHFTELITPMSVKKKKKNY